MYKITGDSTPFHVVVLTALCGVLFFSYLGKVPFFNKGEPREALVVQDIVQHGSWLFPLKRGEEIPSKPPLFHWFAALTSIALGRVTEVTVRFPSAFFATLSVLLLYSLGRKLYDPQSALLGGIILATSVGYLSQAVSARVDMTLAFFITVALVIFYRLYEGSSTEGFLAYAFYFVLGISVLAKGPVGLILPAMVICGFVGLKKRWDFLFRLLFHKGFLLTLIVGLSWYGVALMKGGEDFFNRQIIHENLARFFVHGEGGSGHQKPIYYYLPYLVLDGLPWSLFLPFVILDWFRSRAFAEDRVLFPGLWAGVIFLFFSLSAGKRSAYLLPLYPPLSLLIASWLSHPGEGKIRVIGLRAVAILSLLVGLVLFLPLLGLVMGKDPFTLFSSIAMLLKPKDQAHLRVALETLDRAGWIFLPFLLLSALLWASAGRHLLTANARAAAAQFACLSVLTWFLVQGALMPSIAEARSYKSFMVEVNRLLDQGQPVSVHGEGWDYASVGFYSGGRAPILKGDSSFLRDGIRQLQGYYIMSETEWRKMAPLGSSRFLLELKSHGTGPDGKDPIVLLRAR